MRRLRDLDRRSRSNRHARARARALATSRARQRRVRLAVQRARAAGTALRRVPSHASHGAVVPLLSSASGPPWTPVPSHASHCPCFVLNENQRGSSSGTPVPHVGHARAVESTSLARGVFAVGAPSATRSAPAAPRERAIERRAIERREPAVVDDEIDRVLLRLREARRGVDRHDGAVDARRLHAGARGRGEEVEVRPLARAHRRRVDGLALRRPDAVEALKSASALHRRDERVALGAVQLADLRVEQAQVVGDLGHRGDGASSRRRATSAARARSTAGRRSPRRRRGAAAWAGTGARTASASP